MPERILVIEDEPAIQAILRELLTGAGYEVCLAGDGVEGLAQFMKEPFDLVLLDIMMPRLDGYAVCRVIRESARTPVIMLTALEEEAAQVKAFELQADDYITKPFSLRLALLRIQAVLRRSKESRPEEAKAVLCHQDIRLNPSDMRVYVGAKEISLTRLEFDLLRTFLKRPERVFTREDLLNLVWGYDFAGEEKAVNIHIMNLRRKLGVDCIETIRGVGYRLAKD